MCFEGENQILEETQMECYYNIFYGYYLEVFW